MANSPRVEPNRHPVSVIMERQPAPEHRWIDVRWELLGVIPNWPDGADPQQPTRLHEHAGVEQYLYTGFEIRLYRDCTESYWHNLAGKQPSLFVVLREDDDGIPHPFRVTANYDEAGAYMEADGTVMSAPMPEEICRWLERYVAENFHPQEAKIRKRKNWWQESERAK